MHAASDDALRHPRVRHFVVELVRYLRTEGHGRPPEKALLGTSDVIESLFGKYKQFSERGPLRELGASLLLLPLATVQLTTDLVREALTAMRVKTFEILRRLTFGVSSLSRRRLAFAGGGNPDDIKPS